MERLQKWLFVPAACALVAGCAGHVPPQPVVEAVPPIHLIEERPKAAAAPVAPVAPKEEPRARVEPAKKPAPTAKAEPKKAEAKKVEAKKAEPTPAEPKKAEPKKVETKTEPKVEPAQAKVEPARTAAKPAAPSLDVAGLTESLKETPAIGMFTKLALKNQMDDLIQKIRSAHQSGKTPRATGLRQPYDALVGKVLSLVRQGDPVLARKIETSREGLWDALDDPARFNTIT